MGFVTHRKTVGVGFPYPREDLTAAKNIFNKPPRRRGRRENKEIV